MKKIITCFFILVLSPIVLAEQFEEPVISKEQIASPETLEEKTNKENLKKNLFHEEKPRLDNFASYNDFLKAMYLYKKNEEETIRPNVDIRPPPSSIKKELEPTPIEDNKDVTIWGEELPSEYVILGE